MDDADQILSRYRQPPPEEPRPLPVPLAGVGQGEPFPEDAVAASFAPRRKPVEVMVEETLLLVREIHAFVEGFAKAEKAEPRLLYAALEAVRSSAEGRPPEVETEPLRDELGRFVAQPDERDELGRFVAQPDFDEPSEPETKP